MPINESKYAGTFLSAEKNWLPGEPSYKMFMSKKVGDITLSNLPHFLLNHSGTDPRSHFLTKGITRKIKHALHTLERLYVLRDTALFSSNGRLHDYAQRAIDYGHILWTVRFEQKVDAAAKRALEVHSTASDAFRLVQALAPPLGETTMVCAKTVFWEALLEGIKGWWEGDMQAFVWEVESLQADADKEMEVPRERTGSIFF